MAALPQEGTYREDWFCPAISLQGRNPPIKLMATLMLSPGLQQEEAHAQRYARFDET
jgi:hypothetical protein